MEDNRRELKIILQELLQRVGVDQWPGWDFFKMYQWYTLYEWTEEEQHDFENWMAEHLYKSKTARIGLCEVPRHNRKHLKKVAQEFTFCYGWKFKEN